MNTGGQALRIWRGQAGSPAWNMAADELLLRHANALGQAVLRFYSWDSLSASFGYFQRYADVEAMTKLRPLIRRLTGGGLVLHDESEWTYSLTFPPTHPAWKLKAEESYCCIHKWVRRAFEVCGVAVELCPETRPSGPGQCFVGAEKNDLQFCGNKIAGAAQRRNRDGMLIQGSVQAKSTGIDREAWEIAMLAESDWSEWQPAESFITEATALASSKYAAAAHNQKR
jgi:lipoyl(octanoyl) transferase